MAGRTNIHLRRTKKTMEQVGSRKTSKRVGSHLTSKINFMKKYLLGLSAVVLAIGFSAFTNMSSHKTAKFTTSYYFQVTSTTAWGSEASATLAQITTAPPTSQTSGCNAFTVHDCSLGFTGYYQNPTTHIYFPASSTGQTTNQSLVVGPGSFAVRVGKN